MERERLTRMVEDGIRVSAIARAMGAPRSTTRYWLRKYGLSPVSGRAQALDRPTKNGARYHGSCSMHGDTIFVVRANGTGNTSRVRYRCVKCELDVVDARRRNRREDAYASRGYQCRKCKSVLPSAVLEWHHREPDDKVANVNTLLNSSHDRFWAEVKKCDLLCANCHAEVEEQIFSEQPKRTVVQGVDDVRNLRIRRKEHLVKMGGNGCRRCGYGASLRALHFHHRDPETKMFMISGPGLTKAWHDVVHEAGKCDVLCANCHAIHHASQ
jgi:hypothetical protein